MWKTLAIGIGLLVAIALGVIVAAGRGTFGTHDGPGEISGPARAPQAIAARGAADAQAADAIGVPRPKQVLFGDLHVHSTFSFDAFSLSLPLLGGEGAHPPADACDFARYCSALDFWSINDHAFSVTPEHWRETVDSIRQCNAVAGDPANPDMVSYLGWEWTQVGTTPAEHYGHKNVVLAHTDDERITARAIAAPNRLPSVGTGFRLGLFALGGGGRTHDLVRYFNELDATPQCDLASDTRELPADCMEVARTPAELFRKLDEWGVDSMVIPHGTTWGFYTPPGSSWDKQLASDMHDPKRQRLIEVYSGHGESEVYRSFRAVTFDADGTPQCPAPTPDYLPSCWRAGEIIRERCLADGESGETCEARAVETRDYAARASVAGHRVVAGTSIDDWLDAGQCRDCREPSFNYRPASSAQYIAALGNFDEDGDPRRFRMGFIASSDNHFARPGTGYKEVRRRGFTESRGRAPGQSDAGSIFARTPEEPSSTPRAISFDTPGFESFELERQASFFLTGGLVGAHTSGRSREAIWDALERREVYGTSGPRILLWFELLNPPGSRGQTVPMGGEVAMDAPPVFQVRAVGSFEQQPGCPADATSALGAERIDHLCRNECYHPGDRRRPISRIEVVRIRPQSRPGQDPARLIDDPWRVFDCEPDPAGCAKTFLDPEFPAIRQDVLYYARVFEAPAPAINAGNLRCERDTDGECLRVDPCPGPDGRDDDCLAPHEPRAWSSPIYLDFGA